MKQNSKVLPNSQLWSDWQNDLSADQLLPVIKALKHYLEIKSTDNEYCKLNEKLGNPFMHSLWKNFFNSYKNGEINIALSNKLALNDLCPNKKSKNKRSIQFNDTVNICLVKCNPKHPDENIFEKIEYVEDLIFLSCISKAEAKLYRNYSKLKCKASGDNM